MEQHKSVFRDFLNLFTTNNDLDLKLYFITRRLKEGMKKSVRAMQKYKFELYHIDINLEIKDYFRDLITNQLGELLSDAELEISVYETVVDDGKRVYTYQLKNKAMSFYELIHSNLVAGIAIPSVNSLSELLKQDESVWAYCVDIIISNNRFTLFTKFSVSHVAVEQNQNPEQAIIPKFFRTKFNTSNSMLELLHGDTINFDKRMDCIYSHSKEEFFILHKTNFEKIVALEEEFKESADRLTEDLKGCGVIEGFENVADELENNPTLHRKLHKIISSGEYKTLDQNRLRKMLAISKAFKLELEFKDDKIIVKDKHDLDLLLKLLDDYFVESKQTGNKYGAPVKKRMNV